MFKGRAPLWVGKVGRTRAAGVGRPGQGAPGGASTRRSRAPEAAAGLEGLDLGADRSVGALSSPPSGAAGVGPVWVCSALQPARGVRQAALLLRRSGRSGRDSAAKGSVPRPQRGRESRSRSPRAELGQPAGGSSSGRPRGCFFGPWQSARTGVGGRKHRLKLRVRTNCLPLVHLPRLRPLLSSPATSCSHRKGRRATGKGWGRGHLP